MVEQFVKASKHLKAVSPKTLIWYQCSFKAFDGATSSKGAVDREIVELDSCVLRKRLSSAASNRRPLVRPGSEPTLKNCAHID
jgi:hypothetical protein